MPVIGSGTGGSGGKGGPPPKAPAPTPPIVSAANKAAVDAETKSLISNNKAVQETIENRKNLGRLAEQQPSNALIDYLKREATILAEVASVSQIYKRTLDQLAHSTETYSSSLQANTSNIADATEQADKFLKGTRDTAAAAENLAAAYNMESSAINDASKAAQKMFATQLGAMGNVSKGMKDLQQNSVVLSRYLGVDMKDVINSWSERMDASNMTLEDAQLETAMLTKVTDQYTKALTSVSGEILKTAKVGKKELFEMTKAVNNEFKIGIPNVIAYTAAMSKLAVTAAKLGGTKNEQKDVMEGMAKMGKSLTTMQGSFGLMGMLGAEKLYAQFKSAPETLSKGLRERFEKRSGMIEGAPDIMKRQYIMETAGGSSEMLRASLKELKDRMSGNVDQMAAQLQETTGGSAVTARMLAEAAVGKEGDLDKALKEYEESNKTEAQKQLDKAEELTKQAAKTNDITASIAKTVNSIHKWLIGMAIGSPLAAGLGVFAAGKVLGALTTKLAGGALLSGGAAVAPAATTAAVTSAASTTAAGTIGSASVATALKTAAATAGKYAAAAAVPAALAAGALAVGYVGYKAFKAHEGDKEDEATGRRARGGAKFSKWMTGQNSVDLDANEVVVNLTWEEIAKKKERIKILTAETEAGRIMQMTGVKLNEVQKAQLAEKEKELEATKKRIKAITDAEAKEKALTDEQLDAKHKATVSETLKRGAAQLASEAGQGVDTKAMVANFLAGQGRDVGRSDFNTNVASMLQGNSKEAVELRAKMGEGKFAQFMQELNAETQTRQMSKGTAADEEKLRGMSNEERALEWGKRGRASADTIVPFSESERAAMNKGTSLNIAVASGEGQGDVVTPVRDASDNITIQMPGQKLILNGGELSNQVSDISGRNGAKG